MQKILFIEDNIQLRNMYERVLSLNQCEVTIAPAGAEAIEKLRNMNPLPDAIVLGSEQPGTRGELVLSQIKADPRLAEIPIVNLTNTSDPDWRQKFLESGTDHFLVSMDTSPAEIVRVVSKLVHDRQIPSAATV